MGQKLDERYQFQPWYIKLCRQLRHKPPNYTLCLLEIIKWVCRGCKPVVWGNGFEDSRWETFKHIISTYRSLACYGMQHYHTSEEFIAELRKQSQENNKSF